jgi:3-phenylpropionate/trans-cinnamate dioxygenase ferredoxin reductase subunit
MAAVVIVGGGQAGYEAAVSLRRAKYEGRVILINKEGGLPYRRPPLSKRFLAHGSGDETLLFRPAEFYERQCIELVEGRAAELQRRARRVLLEDGRSWAYDHVVLATGSRPRRLSIPGYQLEGVLALRTRQDATVLRAALTSAERIVVLGGGVIGMEVSAVAATLGHPATIIESTKQPMSRMTSAPMASYLISLHEAHGNQFFLCREAAGILDDGHGRVGAVALLDGTLLSADLVVVGVGAVPNEELAEAAGLKVADGIVVDEHLLTSDESVSAIGDCASYPSVHAGRMVRLESVQNAVDQARCVASRLTGRSRPYVSTPWFWTEQFGRTLQVAGISDDRDDLVAPCHANPDEFSVYHFRGDMLAAVESVGRPSDHRAARRLLAGGRQIQRDELDLPGLERDGELI